jgi:23S rRNA pseudouridine1911/1915/1917 synthase
MLPPIIQEDESIIAVAKPAGIATANVPAGEESVFTLVRQQLAARRGEGGREPPFLGVVSRLDRPVSGVVVFAKTPEAAAGLARQFRERSVGKSYVAIVEGRFPAAPGTWVEWIDSLERPRRGPTRPAAAGHDADEARLRARVLVRRGEVSLVELQPATGRRHQLRAQLGSRRCPIVGDRVYGARLPFPAGIALHARALSIAHPATGDRLTLTAEPPEAWRTRYGDVLAHLPRPER